MKIKFNFSPKFIVPLVILIAVIVILIVVSSSKKNNEGTLYEVKRGTLIQEVSETGTVQKGDKINLSFKIVGQIQKINVETGDSVKRGDVLASLDSTQLYIQLDQAKADLQLAQAELDKLLAGATKEEVQVAQTSVDSAKATLESKQKDLENTRATGEQNLEDAYEDAFDSLNSAYLKLYNASTFVKSLQINHFTGNDQESLAVKENKQKIEDALGEMDFYLSQVESDFTSQNIDFALVNFEKNFSDARECLSEIRDVVEGPNYRNLISSADKTSLDTHRSNINTAYSNIVGEQQNIASVKLTNKSNLDAAESAVVSAQDALKAAEDNLALVTAEPREEDINLYKAKVKSAQARIGILESQIKDTVLRSPINGTVVDVNKSAGEMVQAISPVISILPSEALEVKVDIYEEDIVKIQTGDPVKISLIAFPDKVFEGTVVFIEPAEKLIDGVVYYEVTIDFKEAPGKVKPGMSADVSIITASKEGVLMIPRDGLINKDGRSFVKIFNNKKPEEREIKTGMEGAEDMIEVISGLKEGEKIIID